MNISYQLFESSRLCRHIEGSGTNFHVFYWLLLYVPDHLKEKFNISDRDFMVSCDFNIDILDINGVFISNFE